MLIPTERIHVNNSRGAGSAAPRSCRHGPLTQNGLCLHRASFPVTAETHTQIDPVKLAGELEVDMCAVNEAFWMMAMSTSTRAARSSTSMVSRCGGPVVMIGAEMISEMAKCLHTLASSSLPEHQLDLPRRQGRVSCCVSRVAQLGPAGDDEGSRPQPKSFDNLDQLGSKLKQLPDGWTFETKILNEAPSPNTGRVRWLGCDPRDEFGPCLPRVWLRRRHQRQLRAVGGPRRPRSPPP